MLHKTRGIVFRFTKYGESSIIVNVFTELFGLQSYIVNGVRSKSARNKIALYQPLTLLDLVVYHRENADILRIKEVKCLHLYQTIHGDIRKSAICLFLNEILNKAVRDQSHAEEICDFLIQAFIALDEISTVENFHLIFMLKLGRYLGFGAQTPEEVLEGWPSDPDAESALGELIQADFMTPIRMSNSTRRSLLEALLNFYSRHMDGFGEVKSVQVLKETFN